MTDLIDTAVEDGSACTTPDGSTPLVLLLERAHGAFVHDFDRRLAASEFSLLSLAHSKNILRHLADGPRRVSQFVAQCGVSKQAVSLQVSQLERHGYITVGPDPDDQRARLLALTPKGVRAQHFVREVFAQIEAEWAERLGADEVATLRSTLTRLVEA